jgi:hypothetical protein
MRNKIIQHLNCFFFFFCFFAIFLVELNKSKSTNQLYYDKKSGNKLLFQREKKKRNRQFLFHIFPIQWWDNTSGAPLCIIVGLSGHQTRITESEVL